MHVDIKWAEYMSFAIGLYLIIGCWIGIVTTMVGVARTRVRWSSLPGILGSLALVSLLWPAWLWLAAQLIDPRRRRG